MCDKSHTVNQHILNASTMHKDGASNKEDTIPVCKMLIV